MEYKIRFGGLSQVTPIRSGTAAGIATVRCAKVCRRTGSGAARVVAAVLRTRLRLVRVSALTGRQFALLGVFNTQREATHIEPGSPMYLQLDRAPLASLRRL